MPKSHFLYSKRESLSAQRRGATHGEGPGVLLPKPDHCRALNTKAEHILKVFSSPSIDTTTEEELDWKCLNTHSDPPLPFVIFIYFFYFLPLYSKHLCVHSHEALGAQHLLQGQAFFFFFKQPQTTAVATFRQQDCTKAAHENYRFQCKKLQRICGTQTMSFVWKANKALLMLLQGK